MNVYDCKVRLGGSLNNEVYKTDVTAPEILVLKMVHGADGVLDLKPKGQDAETFPPKRERERLIRVYGARAVEDTFGKAAHVPLPTDLGDPEPAAVDEDADLTPPKKPGRRFKAEAVADLMS